MRHQAKCTYTINEETRIHSVRELKQFGAECTHQH